jgi:hypothetical protein
MSDVQKRNREVLDAIRVRRDDFYEAVLALEQGLAAPAGDDPQGWASSLAEPVGRLGSVLDAHVAGTEGESGLFAEVRDHAPRLIASIDRMQAEHEPLQQSVDDLTARLGSVTSDADVDGVREAGLDLIRRLLVHRHRGAELVYDAYDVDLSGGD